ncbi:transposon Ty3-I Gag-Pol polyprotein [Trichonephila clavipes]|nr:transposon Ty3-I Gag-Pol polyprotein [Trichonephila clavipes]
MAHVDAPQSTSTLYANPNSVNLQFIKAQQADDQITTIKTLLETTPHDNYIVKTNFLQNSQWHRFTSGTDEMQANIIKTAHELGHFAVPCTQDLVSKHFFTSHDLNTKLKNAFKTVLHVFSQPETW